jgi:glycosyltransferase involved in cell wall biosynthesis
MNRNSRVLAANLDWVEAFSRLFADVTVYTIHAGEFDVASNVKVIEIGGGNSILRVKALFKLIQSIYMSFKYRKQIVVFHHMSSKTAAITGLFFRIMRVPQGLWYSHSIADRYLKISRLWINSFFSSTQQSFPIKLKNLYAIGHGIPTSKFRSSLYGIKRSNIVSIGRVAPIKRLERAIDVISKLPDSEKIELHVIGNFSEKDPYFQELLKLATNLNVSVKFLGDFSYSALQENLAKYSYIFSGTPKSIDKALLEGAAAGCLVLSENAGANELTGMLSVMGELGIDLESSLEQRLLILQRLDSQSVQEIRERISMKTSETCDISNTALKIARNLLALES